ncbi:hypothetical protein [Fervidobacterium sp.]
MKKSGTKIQERSKKIAYLGVILGFLSVFVYLGHATPSKWTFLILASYLAYAPYILFDSFFSGVLTVVGLNILAYLFIPKIGYVTTFTFISFYVPVRYALKRLNNTISWIFKYSYFNTAFYIWICVQSKVLNVDILSQIAKTITKVTPMTENFVIYGIIIVGNFFFAAYEYLFGKVEREMEKWIQKIIER